MKIHDLKPAPGSKQAEAPRRSRHRRQGRQDRRPRHEGPGRARHRQAAVRGWPDAAAPPHPEAQGLQQPVPGRVPRREPRHARGLRRRRPRSRPRRCGPGPRGQAGPGQGARPGRAHRSRSRCRRTRSRQRQAGDRSGRRLGRDRARRRGAIGARRPRETPSPTARRHRLVRLDGGRHGPRCQVLSRLRNMFRVADLRNKILFTIFMVCSTGSGRTSRSRTSTSSAIKELQDTPKQRRRRRLPRPVLGRRDHERRRSSSSGSCRTSRRRSSCSCSGSSSRSSSSGSRGPERAEEDHAVDPVPHRRARADPVDRLRVRAQERQRRPPRLRRLPEGVDLIPGFNASRAVADHHHAGRPAPRSSCGSASSSPNAASGTACRS